MLSVKCKDRNLLPNGISRTGHIIEVVVTSYNTDKSLNIVPLVGFS